MTVASETSIEQFLGDGSNKTFSPTFLIFEAAGIAVFVGDVLQTLGTHYQVASIGSPPTAGFDVTFTTAPAASTVVTVRRAEPFVQETDYLANDPFPAETHERALDRVVMMVQRLKALIDRAVLSPVSSLVSGITIPDPDAAKFLRWNAAATALENAEITGSGSIGIPVSIAQGGTNATTAADARVNLGVEIGVDVQAFDADIPTVAATQVEMEAGTETARRSMSPLGVAQAIAALSALPSGHLFGLGLSNNAVDAAHDIDIATGKARSDQDDDDLVLTSPLTIAIDASGEDGLDTGTVTTDATYHVHAYKKPSDGSIHAVFSLSATAPTLPDSATSSRRLGAVLTDGSANIRGFTQEGDEFLLNGSVADDTGSIADGAEATVTLTIPTGVVVWGIFSAIPVLTQVAYFNALDQDVEQATTSLFNAGSNGNALVSGPGRPIRTNTSAQVRVSVANATGALSIDTHGWIDRRGQDG